MIWDNTVYVHDQVIHRYVSVKSMISKENVDVNVTSSDVISGAAASRLPFWRV